MNEINWHNLLPALPLLGLCLVLAIGFAMNFTDRNRY